MLMERSYMQIARCQHCLFIHYVDAVVVGGGDGIAVV